MNLLYPESRLFSALILATKKHIITWNRAPESITDSLDLLGFGLDRTRSFVAKYNNGLFLLGRTSDDKINCYVQGDSKLSFCQIGEDNDPEILRLYNIVYKQFPSVESFVDNFIKDILGE